MIRFSKFMVLGCMVVLFTGCNGPEKDKPIWEHTKITDLAPTHRGKRPGDQLKTMIFNIYIFQMPAEKIGTLDDVWQLLYTQPLKFSDYDAFGANSFSIGFGQNEMWNKIADLLRGADAKRIETVTLFLSDKEANDVAIAILYSERAISYIWRDGSSDTATIGPGIVALRVKAEKIPGSRGVCNFDAMPVFSSPTRSPIPQLAVREKSNQLIFAWCRFGLKMAPNDFLFLGPKRYVGNQTTLDSLFFSRTDDDKPVVRTYLIVCSRIVD